jgi:putative phosphoesterase
MRVHGRASEGRVVGMDDGLHDARTATVAVLADTHAPRFWKSLPPRVAEHLHDVDLILHAGDVCTADVLDDLSAFAPVVAVLGNNDGAEVAAWGADERTELVVAGVRIGMVHDSGPARGRESRLRSLFPSCDVVVFGHSHIPWDTESGGQRLFNPGSPTDRRRQPQGTMGHIAISDGDVRTRIIPVTDPR